MRRRVLVVLVSVGLALAPCLGVVRSGAAQSRSSGAASRPAADPRTSSTGLGTYRVLFVGNSYTRFHAMPLMVRAALQSLPRHPHAVVEMVARPGWTLSRHLERGTARQRIERGRFTHVVLQGHSLSALDDEGGLRAAARELDRVTRARGARTVLYETWARRDGAPEYARAGSPGTPAQMQQQISATYGALAEELHAPLAPAGRAFMLARAALPEVELYREDGSHPSEEGSYLVACTLAGVVSGEDPRTLVYRPWRISRRLAATLRDLAARAIGR